MATGDAVVVIQWCTFWFAFSGLTMEEIGGIVGGMLCLLTLFGVLLFCFCRYDLFPLSSSFSSSASGFFRVSACLFPCHTLCESHLVFATVCVGCCFHGPLTHYLVKFGVCSCFPANAFECVIVCTVSSHGLYGLKMCVSLRCLFFQAQKILAFLGQGLGELGKYMIMVKK